MQVLIAGLARTSTSRVSRISQTSRPWVCSSCRGISKLAARATGRILYRLPDSPARTRFAPSPTGYLHLGSLRTALFSYLLAKSTNGQFLLRVEDTDQSRTVQDAESRIKEDLAWAGLQWDEGPDVGGPHGPYKQSERLDIYREHAAKLLDTGKAYRCFCPREHANLTEDMHFGTAPKAHDCHLVSKEVSDGRVEEGKQFVVRLRLPRKTPTYHDLVYGTVKPPKAAATASDPVLMKSDNWPTYHLACVVDDHLMNITHVVRGAEWIPSTTNHLSIYEAFGWKPPVFGHVGLLTDMQGQKLSKRKFDIDVSSFRRSGVLPEALDNFVALLGWSHSEQKDFMSLEQLVNNFSTKFTKGDAKVQFDKLWFLQRQHAAKIVQRAKSPEALLPTMIQPVMDVLDSSWFASKRMQPAEQQQRIFDLLQIDATNFKTPRDFVERHAFTFNTPSAEDLRAVRPSVVELGHIKHHPAVDSSVAPEIPNGTVVDTVQHLLETLPDDKTSLPVLERYIAFAKSFSELAVDVTNETAAAANLSDDAEILLTLRRSWTAALHRYLRWALVAGRPGPDCLALMNVLGREESARRLELAGEVARDIQSKADIERKKDD